MLNELTKSDWLSLLELPEDKIPAVVVLRGTRNLKANYVKHTDFLTNIIEVGSPNGVFEDIMIGNYGDSLVGYASVYGAPMASEIAHLFGVLGASLIIQTGCCGALNHTIQAGHIICPTSAYCGEGASQYYIQKRIVHASPELVERAVLPAEASVEIHKGPIMTTSALLAEGIDEIECWSRQGLIAVDMETAAAFAVAEYFGMQRLSLLFAFDNPSQGEHILLNEAQKQKQRLLGEKIMLEMVFSLVEYYERMNCRSDASDSQTN